MKILGMGEELHAFRKRIMTLLYEARLVAGMELPWIKVRIVEYDKPEDSRTLGKCFIDKNYITISVELMSWDENDLRHIVWHELGHAYFNAKHDESCPLMHPLFSRKAKNNPSRDVMADAFRRIAAQSLVVYRAVSCE